MASDFAKGLAEALEKATEALTPDLLIEEKLNPLREIERFLWDWHEKNPENGDLEFLCFFLGAFLAKVFYNFTPEIPLAGGVADAVQKFVNELKQTLPEMATCLRDDCTDFYGFYRSMAIVYRRAIQEINQALK